MMRLVIFAVLVAPSFGTPGGVCGYECTQDSECSGCGTAGVCSYPHGKDTPYLPTMTSCVSAPTEHVPTFPPPSHLDSVWPDQWSADLVAWTYPTWASNASDSVGQFLYDQRYGSKIRYTKMRGMPGHVVEAWNANVEGADKMFLNNNGTCFGFNITDPGFATKVGVERSDWMKRCHEAGFAKYVGRELVTVNGKEEWADHFSCRIPYDKVNQSITFQNWHSLGLGSLPKGLPLRVTGGNSQPDPQQSPRMNSVWHYNFNVGKGSSTPADFQWNPTCKGPMCFGCPMSSTEEAVEFFGHQVRKEHMSSSDFMSRARFFPLARATTARDLSRATQRKPGRAHQGRTFEETMRKLNKVLVNEEELVTKRCEDFTMHELHDIQQVLFDARTPQLNRIYKQAGDTRLMAHHDLAALQAEQSWRAELVGELAKKAKAGLCHELVMWFVHHLSAPAREDVKKHLVLPLLPDVQHTSTGEHKVHQRYDEQVSCAICHVTPSTINV